VPPSIVRSPQKQKLVKGLPLDRCASTVSMTMLRHTKGIIWKLNYMMVKGLQSDRCASVTRPVLLSGSQQCMG
jgi:hypothetical protein